MAACCVEHDLIRQVVRESVQIERLYKTIVFTEDKLEIIYTLEGGFSLLDRMIIGIYHTVSGNG